MIRRSVAEDADWIREVAGEVYAQLGDYRKIIPAWMGHPGVLTFVSVDPRTQARHGFILIGFYEPLNEDRQGGFYVADLLAIAVAPEYQKQGVGRKLLEYALDFATVAGERVPVTEMRLTVAETNAPARHLFARTGFEVLDDHHGSYDGGQRAIRLRRRLPPRPPTPPDGRPGAA